jgi:cytochrome c oxidase cbb3-type subunit III
MTSLRSALHWKVLLAASLSVSLAYTAAQTLPQSAQAQSADEPSSTVEPKSYPAALVQGGSDLFRRDCAFCHGRDAGGGESGPDLTRSKLVTEDVNGDKIGAVVRNGRPDKGMPRFDRSEQQIASLVAFIHTQQNNAPKRVGGRKGVDVADLQTGNAEAGKQYFDGAGGCSTCHSPTGDLAGIASRYKGLELEEQMLYPKHAKSRVTVTRASGQTIAGTLAYLDEFTVGLIDPTGSYRSWRTGDVRYKIDAPVDAHVELFSKYTDADIHNLMAYLQTLR